AASVMSSFSLHDALPISWTIHAFPFACASATDHSALKTGNIIAIPAGTVHERVSEPPVVPAKNVTRLPGLSVAQILSVFCWNARSEERRVGKEGRSRWAV